MKVLDHFNDIEKGVRRNNTVVLGLIGLMAVIVVCFTFAVIRLTIYFSSNQSILEPNGEKRRIERKVSDREAIEIEAKHHIAMLYGYFYTLNQYNFDKQIEAAYWLGDESIRSAYKRYKNLGWYNSIIQENIEMEGEVGAVEIDFSVYPYRVSVSGLLVFRKGSSQEKFELNGTCQLKAVPRKFPENPHGLYIIGWEPVLKEINQ